MNPETQQQLKQAASALLVWLNQTFDRIADWVTQQSWKRLAVYAIIALISANILQDTLFSSGSNDELTISQPSSVKFKNDKNEIIINGKVIKLKKSEKAEKKAEPTDSDTEDAADNEENSDEEAKASAAAKPPIAAPAAPAANAATAITPTVPPTAATAVAPAVAPVSEAVPNAELSAIMRETKKMQEQAKIAAKQAREAAAQAKEAAQEATDAVELANTNVQEKVVHYRRQSSRWFMNFVWLALIGLFATKIMMGGKKRAEALTEQARANAEREALQRQVSEAKMQMMQAQVEPHFLFNTLASVEYLIETDPPRAAAMQRSLIKYLRAVLPQMRENPLVITLGREVDLVRDYLELLKMRMEERLEVHFDVADNLRNAAFPPMMLQSLTENAIKHGLECKPEGGNLLIRAQLVDNTLRVSVTDDGMGFGTVKSDSTGLGLASIRERLKLLHGNQARLLIEPNQPSGVCATIEVPFALAQNPD
mgnify:CR=1 FL=1